MEDNITCMVCGKIVKIINHLHLRSHKMSTKEYHNMFPDAPLVSKGTLAARSKSLTGKKRSDESRKKLSESVKKSWQNNPNLGRTGHSLSNESKQKLSDKMMGHKVSAETRKKIGESGLGREPWNKNLTKNDDHRLMLVSEKIKEWNKTSMTDEKKKQISQTLKQRYADGMQIPFAKSGYRKDIQMYVRSSWEANFTRILKHTDQKIIYEQDKFTLLDDNGDIECVYTPDFKIS
ncbi:MAG: MucR family transcriptional regulator, partial [Nitrosopumilus sp.]